MRSRIVVLLILLGLLRVAAPANATLLCVEVLPGTPVELVVAAALPGAEICFSPGVHRLSEPVRPKQGQTFTGRPGAVLSGAVPLTGFEAFGSTWRVARAYAPLTPAGTCLPHVGDLCRHAETVYVDDQPLRRAASPRSLTAGEFYADGAHVWLGADPAGRRVELSLTRAAFVGSATDVTIRNLVIEKFANRAQVGALQCGERWLVENNEVRLNHGIGVGGWTGSTIRRNHVHHNGQMGLSGQGRGILIEENEIAFNNTAGFDPVWEAGGTKFVATTDLVVRRNHSHDNNGPGIWADIDNVNVTLEDNLVEANRGPGIFAEIGYGAQISRNTVKRNGAGYRAWVPAGILVISTSDVVVSENRVKGNRAGIFLINDGRDAGRLGTYELRDVLVTGNVIRMPRGRTGMADWATPRGATGIQFRDNTYASPKRKPFAWNDRHLSRRAWRSAGHS
ncbi:MAG TPA: right-handed parallel beta-helix repeat-containing protein [Actinomycetota bacterium]|nr:right-handed parallel beta-helix repeat-containing protein [Actinomycetota bacterium]